MKKPSKKIVIKINNGLLEVFNVPKGIQLVIQDYDTDGAEPRTLTKDNDGDYFYESVYGC